MTFFSKWFVFVSITRIYSIPNICKIFLSRFRKYFLSVKLPLFFSDKTLLSLILITGYNVFDTQNILNQNQSIKALV